MERTYGKLPKTVGFGGSRKNAEVKAKAPCLDVRREEKEKEVAVGGRRQLSSILDFRFTIYADYKAVP